MIRRLIAVVFIPAYSVLMFPALLVAVLAMSVCWIVTGEEQIGNNPVEAFVLGPLYKPLQAVAEWAGFEAWS